MPCVVAVVNLALRNPVMMMIALWRNRGKLDRSCVSSLEMASPRPKCVGVDEVFKKGLK